MNLKELSKHQKIGIDVDGTLIEHARSHILQRFIIDHCGVKEFYIITFRSHGLEKEIENDLSSSTLVTQVPIRLSHFAGIHTVPAHLHEDHWVSNQTPKKTSKLILADDMFYGWKAEACRQLGCTVLIDDMEPVIGRHCTRLGVVCLNPDHFDE